MAEQAGQDGVKLFGFEIKRAKKKEEDKAPSIVPPRDDEGGSYATASGSHYGQYLNLGDDDSKDNYQLIMKYRGNAMHPEVDMAIEDIVNESITGSELQQTLDINLEDVQAPDRIKKTIKEEFDKVYAMLNFKELGHDIFRRWYIDGRMYHHLVLNEVNPKEGIVEIRPIDAAKMRKVKKVKKKKDPATGADIIEKTEEFFIFQEKPGSSTNGVKMTPDSVSYVTSGLLSEDRKKIVSFLHKALKPINQLRMMEDALVIYRLARAPERRIFYIDEGGRGTEITTLPGGENLGQIEDIIYFQKKVYKSLNVPINRLEQESQFSLGRSTEINRDELKFQKFIDRLRMRFSHLFYGILKKQLILKGICTEEDWESWKNDITVDFVKDNHFTELRDIEVLRERIQTLDMVQNYVGEYYSKEWIQKHVLMLSDEDIENMKKEIDGETEEQPEEEPEQQAPSQKFELKPVQGDDSE